MKDSKDILDNCIDKLYSDLPLSQILEAVKDLVKIVPPTEAIEGMGLTPVQHCCIIMDKFKEKPDTFKEMLTVLINADNKKHHLFSDSYPINKSRWKVTSYF